MKDARFRVSTVLNPPTKMRSALLKIEVFEIEPSGWVTQNLLTEGTVTVWENGCVDALIVTRQALRNGSDSEYLGHWDHAEPSDFDDILEPFLAYFSTNGKDRVD
jgi:hypothetical protein